ncbi:MAG: DUF2877 domain-containing protein [Anaerolineales bacterium]
MKSVRASQITPAGRGWLATAAEARPLHIFEAVCNLVDERGVVLSLQLDPVPASPVSISLPVAPHFSRRTAGFSDYIQPESKVHIEDNQLVVGQLSVEIGQARTWDPRPDWESARAQQEGWRELVKSLAALLLAEAPVNSLAPLLAPEGSFQGQASGGLMAERILSAARPAAEKLQLGLADSDRAAVRQASAALAGLGGGLTPSGDDYLMGVMHALWATWEMEAAKQWSEVISEAASVRTGPLSSTWLLAADKGQATGSWHELLDALLASEERELHPAARRIIQIGHSSGADGLTGFCQTLL